MTAIERMVGHGRKANCDLLRLMTRRNGPTPSALFATFSTTSTQQTRGRGLRWHPTQRRAIAMGSALLARQARGQVDWRCLESRCTPSLPLPHTQSLFLSCQGTRLSRTM